tara:strand:- start:1156 stop:1566 length:411 start_codon:yes stop_codon:yes gene_type:complete
MERVTKIEWYIIFTDQEVGPHWLHFLLKKGFYHCYLFRQIGDYVYYANPRLSNIDTKIYQGMSIDQLADDLRSQPNTKILKFKYPFDFNNQMFNTWNLVPTCVSVVKMFLGIRARAQTPYQLYKHLLKKGAVPFNY